MNRSQHQSRPVSSRLLELLPKRALTQLAGAAASVPVPRPLRAPIYRAYAAAVGADLGEIDTPLDAFPAFNDFFVRPLREGTRSWHDSALCSPCDARLDACGTITRGRMLQAKGIDYAVDELVGDPRAAEVFEGGAYATLYLSPADYHRVHAPTDMHVHGVTLQPGELWPVNGLSVPWVDGLFRRNERVVFDGELSTGHRIAIVMVGATVVGRIRVADSRVPEMPSTAPRTVTLEPPWSADRGDELGAFLLGSTVIVVVQAAAGLELAASPGAPIRLGQALMRRELA